MKKILILLLGVAVISSACGRADKKAAAKQAEIERIRMRQDSARRADEERMQELQMKARQDSLQMAMAMSSLAVTETSAPSHASAYYVVIGSFLSKSNANSYLDEQKGTFSDAKIIRHGKWNMVCVGGTFSSFRAAARTLDDVKSQLGGGSEDESGDEEMTEDTTGAGDEEMAEESFEEEDGGGSEGGGQAWVMGI